MSQVASEGEEMAEDKVRILFEFQQRVFWESANLFAKGFAYYLAIVAALIGYTLTLKLQASLQQIALFMGLGSSFLGLLVAWVCVRGFFRVLASMERTGRMLGDELFEAMGLEEFFRQWRSIVWTYAIGATLLALMFATATVLLLKRLGS